MEAVFATVVDQVVPLSVERSILYPVIVEPPLLDGTVQERLICDEDAAVAVSPVGDPGTVVVTVPDVVADDVFDGALEPTLLIAETLYVYAVLDASPVSEYVVPVEDVVGTVVDQVVPLSVERSILYPVIAAPPLLDGAVQDKLICDDDNTDDARLVGDDGAVLVVGTIVPAIEDRSV